MAQYGGRVPLSSRRHEDSSIGTGFVELSSEIVTATARAGLGHAKENLVPGGLCLKETPAAACPRAQLRKSMLRRSSTLTAAEHGFLSDLAKRGDENEVAAASGILANDNLFFDVTASAASEKTEETEEVASARDDDGSSGRRESHLQVRRESQLQMRRESHLEMRRKSEVHRAMWRAHASGISTNGTISKGFIRRNSSICKAILPPHQKTNLPHANHPPLPIHGVRGARRRRSSSLSQKVSHLLMTRQSVSGIEILGEEESLEINLEMPRPALVPTPLN